MEKVYPLAEMKQIFHGQTQHVDETEGISRFSTDTRTLQPGDWFLCLQGETMDGHDYIPRALEAGAAGVIADPNRIPAELREVPFARLLVADPNLALRQWARAHRSQFTGTVLAVTGSNGKTSTKEILAQLCGQLGTTHATSGNFNNFIGVPLTILEAPLEAQWWVIELGTNHPGEISTLSQIAQPHGGILTNVGESHLEFLISTEGVAREKSGLFHGMASGSRVVVPHDLMHADLVGQQALKHEIQLQPYALEPQDKATVASKVKWQGSGVRFHLWEMEFQAALHNPLHLKNLVASLVLLQAQGCSVESLKQAAAQLEVSVRGRFQQLPQDGWLLIDDSYNANPDSFRSVIRSVRDMFPDRRLLLAAGPMAELGDWAPMLHRQVAQAAAAWGVSHFWTLHDQRAEFYEIGWGEGSGSPETFHLTPDHDTLAAQLRKSLQPQDIVLVKGSRSARMELVAQALQASA